MTKKYSGASITIRATVNPRDENGRNDYREYASKEIQLTTDFFIPSIAQLVGNLTAETVAEILRAYAQVEAEEPANESEE